MLKNFGISCLILLLLANGDIANADTVTYISEPPGTTMIKKDVINLKKEINALNTTNAQEIYDFLSARKKDITDKNLLEIHYVLISFLREQSNVISNSKLKKKINSLLEQLNWIYSDHAGEKFSDKVTNLGRLLKSEIFIHLSSQKMSECLDIAHNLRKVIEYSNIGNDLTPEDGPDYFNSDFFLKREIDTAEEIYSQVIELENLAKSFSQNSDKFSQQQLTDNLKRANDFINKLKSTTIAVGNKKVKISRNIRKHLKNLASSSIEKLIERKNQIEDD